MALRDVFVSANEVVTGYRREVCDEELSDLYFLPNIVWMAMSVMRWRDM